MSNWVREKAYAETTAWRDPWQLWSALKTSIQDAIATWNTIYCPPSTQEILVSSSADSSGDSCMLTVVVAPVGATREDCLQVAFDPSQNLIHVTPQPYKKTFHVYVDEANRVGLKQQDVPSSKDLVIEDACRLILEPLIDSLGPRQPIRAIEP